MFALLSVLLLSSQALPLVQSGTCNETTEYLEDKQCCKKCEPGQLLVERCKPGSPDTRCKPCGKGFFMEDYNTNFGWCDYCKKCTKDHMKYSKTCTLTSDAVCTCDEGYRCSDDKCETCVKVPTTTLSHTSPSTAPTASTKKTLPTHDMHDHVEGSCQHQRVSGPTKRATLDPVSAQRRISCQCRRCVERQRKWRMSERGGGRRPLMRLWIEYLL
ncbi:CD27 antigen isoform X3 [Chanodichthys erythropterus]|uniref:CD27 antigen isoform X3 n=1 Tax=Chanodichthys erythropterus TaxID=933992 RepID=UPI00351EC299